MHDPTPAHTDKRPGILSASLIFLSMGIIWTGVLLLRVFWLGHDHELSYAIGTGLGLGVGFAGLYLWASKEDLKSRTGKQSVVLAIFLTLVLTTAVQITLT